MAKGSGNTRNQRNINTHSYTDDMNEIANTISKGGYVTFEKRLSEVWLDMSLEEKELTLMTAGFTGLTNEELESFGSIYIPTSKNQLITEMQEAIVNEVEGYGMDDSTMFTIGYKNGKIETVSHDYMTLDLTSVESKKGYKSRESAAIKALNIRDIDWIITNDGYQEPRYYSSNKGMKSLKEYGGFEVWKNGRGEKKRDYIQDDWI